MITMPHSYLKDAARRRAARTGGSYQKTLQALTRFDEPRPAAPLTPAGMDWSPLHAVEVTFTNDVRTLRGVVLPPDGVRLAADVLRVAVTDPHTGLGPAEVTYLDARWWRVDPMPADVEKRFRPSRRRTRGPGGLPLYRGDNLPATALATRTMLERQYRMRVADGQEPVAEYLANTEYTSLFAIDDAAAMPAQSPKRRAAWVAARTCARCGAEQATPSTRAQDGARYCEACRPLAADAWWTEALSRAQQLASAWACDVVADPGAVVAAGAGWPFTRVVVREVATGPVLHDITVMVADQEQRDGLIDDDDPRHADCTPMAEVAEIMTGLASRRILSWGLGLSSTASRLIRAGRLAPTAVGEPVADGWSPSRWDDATRWYAYWLSEHAHPQPHDRPVRWAGDWTSGVSLRGLPREVRDGTEYPDGLLEQCSSDVAVLRAMAAGPPTTQDRAAALAHPHYPISVTVWDSVLSRLEADARAAGLVLAR
jgi:hypothetical protein